MNPSYLGPLLLCVCAVCALVIVDFRSGSKTSRARLLFKPLAALAFLWLAITAGALTSTYGQWLLAGLLLCAMGYLCLMFDNERSFLAGLFAFLCGHLLYGVAFLQLPANLLGLAVMAIPALLLMVLALRWLWPTLPTNMRGPVLIYIVVITAMLLAASLTWSHPAATLIIAGAVGFAISDLAVARNQFVAPGPINGLWGSPLYFFSQMLLAASAATY